MRLFIIGNPRSGTSLFRLLLTSHSLIHIPPECGFMIWWLDKYRDWTTADIATRLDVFLDDFFMSRKIEFWKLDRSRLMADILNAAPKSYTDLCDAIYAHHAKGAGKLDLSYLGDKNNFHVSHIDALSNLYPDALFIHIVRDGRDVATSYMSMEKIETQSQYRPNLPSDIEKIALDWKTNLDRVRSSFSVLSDHKTFEIRYEDLVGDTKNSLSRLCRFLGLEYEPGMLSFYEENQSNALEPEEFMSWKHRTFSAVDTQAIGKYKNLAESDIQRFEAIAGDILKAYDYQLETGA